MTVALLLALGILVTILEFYNEEAIGILFTRIVLTYVRKNCSSDREKLLKFEAEGRDFA